MKSFQDFINERKENEVVDEKMSPTQKIKRDLYLKTKLAPKIQKYISIYGKAKARSRMMQDANRMASKPLGEDVDDLEETIYYDFSKSDDKISHYTIHKKDGTKVGKATTKNGARNSIDRHDNK